MHTIFSSPPVHLVLHPLIIILIASAILFGAFLPESLVYDDLLLVGQNQTIKDSASLVEVFSQHLWEGTPQVDDTNGSYYRPLMILSLLIDNTLFGENYALYHLHSLFWHLLCCTLFWFWLAPFLHNQRAKIFAVSCFAIHPVQLEAVAFLAARNDPMACAGVLGMLLALRHQRYTLACLSLLFGLLCKESAMLIPFLWTGYTLWKAKKIPLPACGSMFVAFTVYFTLRTFADISWPSSSDPSLLHVATGFLVYLDHFFFPTLLLPATHVLWPSSMELIGGGIGLFLLLIITLKTQENNTRIWGLSLFFAGLIPAFSAIAQTGLTADRYLYIPMLGLSLLMANQLEQISSYVHARMKKHIFGWAAGLIITVYTIQSIRILPNWNDNLRLFSKSAEVHSSPYQAGALAKALEEEGQLDDAAYWYEQAIQPPIPYQHSCYNITWIHLLRRDMLKIVSTGERALQAGCTPSAELLAPLALGYAYAGNWKQAELLTKNSTRDPRNIFFLVSVTLKARARDIAAFDELRYQSAIPDAIKILQQSDQETVQWLEDLISK